MLMLAWDATVGRLVNLCLFPSGCHNCNHSELELSKWAVPVGPAQSIELLV